MNSRSPIQPYLSNSHAIRQEIQRFESVHPSIYAIYDLIEAIPSPLIQQQIREHVVCIEDSFVNSQEWTLSRSVPDLKLGILGSVQSGKSALVHRYLTGSYMQEESPEGGRFKKEVIIDGQSYLLLIRDEGGIPEMQFCHWVDAVIFVFSLENEESFKAVYTHFAEMAHHRNTTEIPLILVGTQDAISESNPRVIDDTRARKLASDLKRCAYYETCATYGLNVERVFQDACQKISQSRYPHTVSNVPSTPNHSQQRSFFIQQTPSNKPYDTHSNSSQSTSSSGTLVTGSQNSSAHSLNQQAVKDALMKEKEVRDKAEKAEKKKDKLMQPTPIPADQPDQVDFMDIDDAGLCPPPQSRKHKRSNTVTKSNSFSGTSELRHLSSPNVTPIFGRKNRQFAKSSLTPKKEEEKKTVVDGETLGSGRLIPLKQGYLYKKSHGLNKDWKKKYVALHEDGRLTYHPNLHDYMENVHGKEIPLQKTTVKLPGLRPRGSRGTQMGTNGLVTSEMNNLSIGGSGISNGTSDAPRLGLSSAGIGGKSDTPLIKKRHRRAKSGGIKSIDAGAGDDSDGYEFVIISIENKQWHFEAPNVEDRDDWVTAIEQQILTSLQRIESTKSTMMPSCTDPAGIQATRNVRGNNTCVDCGAQNPDWASINLGALLCIECSGIHRNLGTHLSRVRSLDLDEWAPDLIHVMTSVGNQVANSVWEANTKGQTKPTPTSPREEKEKWIRAKYEHKEFLPPPPYIDIPIHQQLIDALVREDIKNIILILGHARTDDINAPYSKDDGRTALHIASALGNVVFVQLLLWYNANVKVIDHEGRNALWYARSSGSGDCVELLQNNGCPEHPTLPRRRGSNQPQKSDMFDKLPASVI